jgi:histidine kinase
VSKLIVAVGIVLLLSISAWAYFNISNQKKKLMETVMASTARLTTTIRLGTHYAMMLNSRDEINQIIRNISKQPELENIRIYNKEGKIKFSNRSGEVDRLTNIKEAACDICHQSNPPLSNIDINQRTRIFNSPKGYRLIGVISPIRNEPGCASDSCHVHPADKKILGAMDVVISLKNTDAEIMRTQKGILGFTASVFLMTSSIIVIFVMRFVNHPIRKLIEGTKQMAKGDYKTDLDIQQVDEMGQLASAISRMGEQIAKNQMELNRQKEEYRLLFENVPCLITVQDKNFKLIQYNQQFEVKFDPAPGDFCYQAYKGLTERCRECPVEKTFADGESHYTEETGIDKDGSIKHWFVRSSPIKNADGEMVAAMEISLDITHRKNLENDLEKSEKKYHAIFNNIPNPVFVLDIETLDILDCNNSVANVYGYDIEELIGSSFLDLFLEAESSDYRRKITTTPVINQAKHITRDKKLLFVNIRCSPSEYLNRKVLLVTTSDITKRLEAEQQLIQASKMATLGEMATGIAHELNQPLSVIKTASSFFIKKINKKETIENQILNNMLTKVDNNVDRAAKIINHMRQFARKSDMELEKVQINTVLENAFEMFSQQLKIRAIDIVMNIDEKIPFIYAESGRLEQVFINLLLNARDTIEERWQCNPGAEGPKTITLSTFQESDKVICKICDTGTGIPDAVADKIFEPFFTTKNVGEGTGLGLSISYGIIKDCGGDIEAVPNGDQGTCFIVRFPVSDNTKIQL